jgi:frataxin-like iron-binding protein CyaY
MLYGSFDGTKSGILKLSDIVPASVKATFGNPLSETTEFSEVDNSNILIYKYPAATISFFNNEFLNIDIKDEGFSIILSKKSRKKEWLTSGSEGYNLYTDFNASWSDANPISNQIHIFLKNKDGIIMDSYITFIFAEANSLNNPENSTINRIIVSN